MYFIYDKVGSLDCLEADNRESAEKILQGRYAGCIIVGSLPTSVYANLRTLCANLGGTIGYYITRYYVTDTTLRSSVNELLGLYGSSIPEKFINTLGLTSRHVSVSFGDAV